MLFSAYTIRDNLSRINSLNEQIKSDTKADILGTYKNKFYAFAYDLALAVGEIYFTTGRDLFYSKYQNILMEIRNAQTAESAEGLKRALTTICQEFDGIGLGEYNKDDFNRVAERWGSSYNFRIQESLDNTIVLNEICNSIVIPRRDINLFYPDCYNAENISAFINSIDGLKAYGNEAKEGALSAAKRSMHKAVKGVLRGSRIQNNAFDIVYVQPPISLEIDENDIFANRRAEKNYIADMFKYLRVDGVMVITMPYTRLFKDVCTMLSKQLKDIQIIKAVGEEFYGLGMIHIVGQKEVSKEPKQEEYTKLRRLFEYTRIIDIIDIDKNIQYTLPRQGIFIDMFKGSALDLEEVEQIIDSSSLMNKMWQSQKVEKLDETIKNPLLPFNIGQLGLVLTSGCLDGIVNEEDGYNHLIKGRVSKQIMEAEVEKDGKIELTETTVNKVEINVLLPNGEFKVLA